MIKKKKIVKFITYDGILEPIGASQVLSYCKYLSKSYSIKILSYEKKIDLRDKNKINSLKKELNKFDISWKFKKYHKYPLFMGSLLDILNGILDNLLDICFYKIRNFHIRGPIPGLTILNLLHFFNIQFIYDMRGLWADEKVDRLNWSKKKIFYRFFKEVEKKLLIKSKSIVCLTIDAEKILIKDLKINKNKINIIPTCVNTNEFKLKNYFFIFS